MAVTNGYALLEDVKGAMRITDADEDITVEAVIEAASRLIDAYCDRSFTPATGTPTARTFVADNCGLCRVDDFQTTTGLVVKTDGTGDGTFDLTWSSSDFQLEPLNGRRSGQAWPYHTIRAVGSHDFPTVGARWSGQALVEVTADWGWTATPDAVNKATIIQAVSLFKAKDAPLGFAGFGDMGQLRVSSFMHPQATLLLRPYRRHAVKVA